MRKKEKVVRPERFELPAFWFVARRSIQLSYGRTAFEFNPNYSTHYIQLVSASGGLYPAELRAHCVFNNLRPRFDLPPCCGNYYNENSGPRRRHCSSFAALSANFCMAFGHGIIERMEKWADSGGCHFRRNLFARSREYAGPIEHFHVDHFTPTQRGARLRRRLANGDDGVCIRSGSHERGALVRERLHDEAL